MKDDLKSMTGTTVSQRLPGQTTGIMHERTFKNGNFMSCDTSILLFVGKN